ncbi:type II toxin-antitoxin system VapC family toxin [Arthrobacter sulfonylureivorans]|uniref:type II toxin-antitoxin system VapC family toxin n=1 Tax=Arthrobacter sulfonylureivorans TaxID=2486855 RepID=UPI0039E7119C
MTSPSGLVVDASVMLSALVGTPPERAWARNLLKSGQNHATELALFEAANVLRRKELSGRLTSIRAAAAFGEMRQWPLQTWPFGLLAARIWELRHSITAYDAAYVALAEQLELPLATRDVRLAKAPGPRCRFVTPESGLYGA